MKKRRLLLIAPISALFLAMFSASISPATAGIHIITYKMIDHSKKTDVTDFSHRLGVCKAESNGTKCNISKGKTSTRSIDTSFGLSKGWVAGKLNISSSSSVTVTVGCSTVTLKKGQKLEAFPVGSKHKYKIRKRSDNNKRITYDTSGWRYTYNPYVTGIACRISG